MKERRRKLRVDGGGVSACSGGELDVMHGPQNAAASVSHGCFVFRWLVVVLASWRQHLAKTKFAGQNQLDAPYRVAKLYPTHL